VPNWPHWSDSLLDIAVLNQDAWPLNVAGMEYRVREWRHQRHVCRQALDVIQEGVPRGLEVHTDGHAEWPQSFNGHYCWNLFQ
jgi:hypothetical protein